MRSKINSIGKSSTFVLIEGASIFSFEFETYLKACGIVSQCMPGWMSQRNGVSEQHNCTLLDSARSMMSLSDLSISFWGYALEIAVFILNRVPSKSVETTPYELWHGNKPTLLFLRIWGCEAYLKKLQPDKLESKSEKMHLYRISKGNHWIHLLPSGQRQNICC
jgi:hypothetical protein